MEATSAYLNLPTRSEAECRAQRIKDFENAWRGCLSGPYADLWREARERARLEAYGPLQHDEHVQAYYDLLARASYKREAEYHNDLAEERARHGFFRIGHRWVDECDNDEDGDE